MARATDPNCAGSQLFIVFKWLTVFGQSITVFGRVTEGMNTVDKIASVPTNEEGPTSRSTKGPYKVSENRRVEVSSTKIYL
jgi:cyclophilin family peptidyl-prolyl cis-trans isomerase